MATVRLDGMLREFIDRRTVTTDALNVEGVLNQLEAEFPRLRRRLRDETFTVRPFVRIYVNGEDISTLQGVRTPLRAEDSVEILHSIQGG